MAQKTITEKDEGKRVVNYRGDKIGMISTVKSGTAYVDPDPGITDKVMAKMGWDDIDEDNYPLDSTHIESITDDEVRLRENI